MNSTLVFCTSYIESEQHWNSRYERWLRHHAKVFPESPLFLIDDASPYLPQDPDISVTSNIDDLQLGRRATIFRFEERLGRISMHNFPGWFRSFMFSFAVAEKLGFRKIIHIESDAFILSKAALNRVTKLSSGWTAFWCPKWEFPESAFQVICEDEFPSLRQVGCQSFEAHYADRVMEQSLPFSHIDKTLLGDRYGDYRTNVPSFADFAGQVSPKVTFRSDFA
jgi:hypothetical protein